MSEYPTPRISVIVPHYNDLERLDACLAALEAQSLPRDTFEVIVADNRSPVGVDEVTRLVGKRGRVIDAPIAGAGMARNSGVDYARAAILAFTDCDCVPEPHWLEQGVAALESADFVGGRMKVLVENPAHMSGAEAFEAVFAFDNRGYVLREHFTVTANLFCPRDLFHKIGPFRTEVSEDKEWCLRARAMGHRIGYAEKAVVGHPARADYVQLKGKWKRMASESYALFRQNGGSRLRWLGRTWMLPLSILAHSPRVLASKELPDMAARLRALVTLVRIRLWRFREGHRQVFGG